MESLFTFLTGIVSALVPIIGQHLGQGKKNEVASDYYQFMYLSLGLSLILFALVFLAAPVVLQNMSLESTVKDIAIRYLRLLAIGTHPTFTIQCSTFTSRFLRIDKSFHVFDASLTSSQQRI